MRLLLLGNESDFVLTHPHAAVGSIQMRVTTGTGLKFQGLRCLIEGPDAGESNLQRYLFVMGSATHPLETRAAVGDAFLNIFAAQHSGAFTIRLKWGRSTARVFTQ